MRKKARRPVKIALVGSLSVGKTTILNILRKKYKGRKEIAFVDEVAREYFQKYGMKERFSVKAQSRIQELILKREQKIHNQKPKYIVCDRSVIDSVVYLKSYGDKKGSEILLERIRLWLPTYHTFFLLSPSGWIYSTDEIRTEDQKKRRKVHLHYVHFFKKNSLPMKMLTGGLAKRLADIEEYLNNQSLLKLDK